MKQHINKLVLVLAGGNYKWDRQEIACRETWANPFFYRKDTRVYFVRAHTMPCAYDKNMQDINSQSPNPFAATPNWKEYMRSKSIDELLNSKVTVDHDTRTIFCDIPDGIAHGLLKLMLAMREMQKYYSWNYLVRPNTGSYVNLNILDEVLTMLPKEKLIYGFTGFNGKYKFATGSCSTFSDDVCEKFISNIKDMLQMQLDTADYEDNIFGFYTNNFGYDIINAPKIDVTYDRMVVDSNWFHPQCYHYYFVHTKDDRPHHLLHKMFYARKDSQ
jgi:hypothetical protein